MSEHATNSGCDHQQCNAVMTIVAESLMRDCPGLGLSQEATNYILSRARYLLCTPGDAQLDNAELGILYAAFIPACDRTGVDSGLRGHEHPLYSAMCAALSAPPSPEFLRRLGGE